MFGVKQIKNNKKSSFLKYLISFVTVILLIYFAYPYWPKVQYHITTLVNKNHAVPVSFSQLNTEGATQENVIKATDIAKTNKLLIPKINVETNIVEGETLDVLNVYEGVWREPGSSTPLVSGNMVLAGHRFQYLPPNTNTFYNLEEMEEGDDIYIQWQGVTFWYKVYKTMLVNPDQIEVRNSDPDLVREITLYTCTPLYTSERRFVVKASLIGYQ